MFTFIWGANFILAEVALKELEPISFSVSRFAIGGLAMLAVLYLQSYHDAKATGNSFRFFPSIDRKDWKRLLVVSVLGATLAPWLGIEGLSLTNGARASLWLALGPAISTGFGYVFSTEKMDKFGYIGVIMAGLGTIILAYDGISIEKGYWLGDLFLVTALVMTVVELHLIKPLARKYGPISMVALRTVIGGTLYLFIASPTLIKEPWLTLSTWTWIAILAGGAIGVGVGQWVKVRALRALGPTQVVIYGNLVPITAMLIAWFSVGEDPTIAEIISAFFIVGGAFLMQVVDARRISFYNKMYKKEDLSVAVSTKQD